MEKKAGDLWSSMVIGTTQKNQDRVQIQSFFFFLNLIKRLVSDYTICDMMLGLYKLFSKEG